MKMKRVLVTGGSGRLGSFVVRALIDSYQVTVLDLAKPTESCEFVIGSVLDRAVLTQALHGQDAVIHLAALDAAVSATDAEFMRVNVEGTWNLFECAHSAGIGKVVHYSSVAALNISRHNPPRYLPVDATHPADPQDGYGLSKLIGEKDSAAMCRARHASHLSSSSARDAIRHYLRRRQTHRRSGWDEPAA